MGDLIASAGGLCMGEGDEGIPAAVVRGLPADYSGAGGDHCGAGSLVRPLQEDLFQ